MRLEETLAALKKIGLIIWRLGATPGLLAGKGSQSRAAGKQSRAAGRQKQA